MTDSDDRALVGRLRRHRINITFGELAVEAAAALERRIEECERLSEKMLDMMSVKDQKIIDLRAEVETLRADHARQMLGQTIIELTDLKMEIEALRADRERLDWLAAWADNFDAAQQIQVDRAQGVSEGSIDIRDCIDAAREGK